MRLHVERHGRGPDLVMIHGWGMNSAVWGELLPNLRRRYRVSMVELPGHGHSPLDPDRTALVDWASDCLESAPESAVWMGWSLGGQLALQAALDAPSRVRGLVLMATTPCFVAVPGWPDAMREEVLAQFAGNLENDPRQTLERFLSLQVRGSEAARQSLRRLKSGLAQRPAPGVAALEAGLRLLAATDLRQRLSEVRCDSLWMYGQRDTLVPAAACDAVRPMQPNGRFLTFPGAGHAPFLSHAGACLEAIDAFMEAVHAPLF